MLRRFLIPVLAICALAAPAQDYTETWRDITPGRNASEKVVWRKVQCAANDDVVVAGTATDSATTQLILKRLDASGNEIWTVRDVSGAADQLQLLDVRLDAAGNAYVLHHDLEQHRLSLVSFTAATGTKRWTRTFDVQPFGIRSGFPQGLIVVGTRGNTTFVYAVVNNRTSISPSLSGFRIERLNSASGATTTFAESESTSDTFISTGALDNTGNLIVGVLRSQGSRIEKFSQALAAVWNNRITDDSSQIFVASHPVTQEVLGIATQFGRSHFALVDRVTGTALRTGLLLDTQSVGVVAAIEPFSTGAWHVVCEPIGANGRVTVGVSRDFQEFARKHFFGALSAAVDASGTLHYVEQFGGFGIANFPRGNPFRPFLEGSAALSVAADSQDRVVVVGATNEISSGAVVQASQPFVVATDVFTRPFTSELEVLAPGVLGNDLHTNGGELSIVSAPSKGQVTLNADGSFRYVAGASFNGDDQFQYRVLKGAVARTATCFVKRLRMSSFSLDKSTVVGEEKFRARATLSSATFVSDIEIPITSNDPTVQVRNLVFTLGQAAVESDGTTRPVTATRIASLSVTLSGETVTQTLTVVPGGFTTIESAENAPIIAGRSSEFRLLLTGPAPTARTYLIQTDPAVVSQPTPLTVPAGASSAGFVVSIPDNLTRFSIIVTVIPGSLFIKTFDVKPQPILTRIELLTEPLYAGVSATVKATLDSPTGTSPNFVILTSSISTANVPAFVKIVTNQAAGSTGFTSELTAANQNLTVTGTLGSSTAAGSALIRPNLLDRFSVSPNNAPVGGAVTGTVDLNWVAPARGQVVTIKTSTPSLVSVPDSITIPAGQTTKSYAIIARSAGFAKVTVSIGKKSITKGLTVTP